MESSTEAAKRPEFAGHRYLELDSLRGVAACSVVLHHAFRILWIHDPAFTSTAHLLVNALVPGRTAVILFFVLSGFVLTVPWLRADRVPYLPYLAKRFCRLYLPYAVGLLLCALAAYTAYPLVTGNGWFDKTWAPPITVLKLLKELAVSVPYSSAEFNTSYWTLLIELRISLVFPLLALVSRRLSGKMAVVVTLGAVLAGRLLGTTLGHNDAVETVLFACYFFMGSCLCVHLKSLAHIWRTFPLAVRVLITVVSILLFLPLEVPSLPLVGHHLSFLLSNTNTRDLLTATASLALILSSIESTRLRHVLHWSPLLLLGMLSYSIYLVHGIILFWLTHQLWQHATLPIIVTLGIVLTFPLAYLFHRLVELPTIQLGRRAEKALR